MGIFKKLIPAAAAVTAVMCLTSCGESKIDVINNLTISYTGYNGYGNAEVSFISQPWIDKADEKSDGAPSRFVYENAVTYTIEPADHLSNGDVITVTAEVDNTDMEKYHLCLVGGSQTYTVEGLEKPEKFDPFENVSVTFDGIAPNATASVRKNACPVFLEFSLDKSKGLSNGDTVKVSVKAPNGDPDVEKYCLEQGYAPSSTEKEFKVEGLSAYAAKLSDIPEDMLKKMNDQVQDVLKANVASGWAKESTLVSSDLIGYYFLTPKDEVDYFNAHNYLYLVYKNKAHISENSRKVTVGDVNYYYCAYYQDIMILEDGTCSVKLTSAKIPSNEFKKEYKYEKYSWEETGYYYFKGYTDLDSMFNDCVTTRIANYKYENTVEKQKEDTTEAPTEAETGAEDDKSAETAAVTDEVKDAATTTAE